MKKEKTRAPRNQTLTILDSEKDDLNKQIVSKDQLSSIDNFENKIVNCNYKEAMSKIVDKSISLLILDPPYNLNKKFNSLSFSKTTTGEYTSYLEDILSTFLPKLKADATVYIVGIGTVRYQFTKLLQVFKIRNRITWEREKEEGQKLIGKTVVRIFGFVP